MPTRSTLKPLRAVTEQPRVLLQSSRSPQSSLAAGTSVPGARGWFYPPHPVDLLKKK